MLVLSPIDHKTPTNAMRRMLRRKSRVSRGGVRSATASVRLQALVCGPCEGGIQLCRDPSNPMTPPWWQRC